VSRQERVEVGSLGVCASAAHVNAVARQMAHGAAFEDALAPIGKDFDALFAKLGHLVAGMCEQ
jgi:hypothetical protein